MHRHFLVAAVLATVSLLMSSEANFATYKLSLHWPAAACNDPASFECKPNVLNTFTIHGLWPQFANGNPVRPYDPETNRCTDVIPVNSDQILNLMTPLQDFSRKLWPNYKDYQNQTVNENCWKYEWKLYGMYSDSADNPYRYFSTALSLAIKYIDPYKGTRIVPRLVPYMAKDISDAIKENLGVYPQIACNEVRGIVQLKEVRLCFTRDKENPPSVLQDCPRRYANKCSDETNEITFIPHLIG
ncbi:hypothetical protein QUC31_005908 [Theobroma cacao]